MRAAQTIEGSERVADTDLAERTVFHFRGRTWHWDDRCVKVATQKRTLDSVLHSAENMRPCTRCALEPVLAFLAGLDDPGAVVIVATTWPVGDDAESWQLDETKRNRELGALRVVAERWGIWSQERRSTDPARSTEGSQSTDEAQGDGEARPGTHLSVVAHVPASVAAILKSSFRCCEGPGHGAVPSEDAAAVFVNLFLDDERCESAQGRRELWEIAQLV